MVIFDVTMEIVIGHKDHVHLRMANLTDKCFVCSDCSTNQPFPSLYPLLGPPYSLRHHDIEIRQINNPIMDFKCSSKRKSRTCLILNQKLEII